MAPGSVAADHRMLRAQQSTRESVRAQLCLKYQWHNQAILARTKTHDSEKLFNLVSRRLENAQENHRLAEKQTKKLFGVLERAQAFVIKGDEPVTVTHTHTQAVTVRHFAQERHGIACECVWTCHAHARKRAHPQMYLHAHTMYI